MSFDGVVTDYYSGDLNCRLGGGIAINQETGTIYVSLSGHPDDGDAGKIMAFSENGLSRVVADGLSRPQDILYNADDGFVYYTDALEKKIIKILGNGRLVDVARGFSLPRGFAKGTANEFFVIDQVTQSTANVVRAVELP